MFNSRSNAWLALINDVELAVPKIAAKVIRFTNDSEPEGTGGYFGLRSLNERSFMVGPMLSGEIDNDRKSDLCLKNCWEMTNRLISTNERYNHISSYQSREPQNGKYGGAIIGTDDNDCKCVLVFSGIFTEHTNETIALLVAIEVGLLTEEQAAAIAQISGNTVYFKIVGDTDDRSSQELADELSSILSSSECDEIARMNQDSALSYITELLLKYGINPEKYLKAKIIS